MRIGVIGYGFVGDAVVHGCNIHDINVAIYDKYKPGYQDFRDIVLTDIVFVCVPTPMGVNGEIDPRAVSEVLDKLDEHHYPGIVAIKSTIIPRVISDISKQHPHLAIVANPEFLTERQARHDFLNAKWVVIGADKEEHLKPLTEFYKKVSPVARRVSLTLEGAMMVKYMTNTWFATKVSLMNEFYKLWESYDYGGWEDVANAFGFDERVGQTHLMVPGVDGDYGWGGKCFPKDLNAILSQAKKQGSIHHVMEAAWQTNLECRANKDWLSIDGATSNYNEDE